jgi:hypothetical protein
VLVDALQNCEGTSTDVAAGSGHIVRMKAPPGIETALVARYV